MLSSQRHREKKQLLLYLDAVHIWVFCRIGGVPPADVDPAVVPERDGGGDGIGEGGDRALGEQRALAQYLHVRLDPQAALAA